MSVNASERAGAASTTASSAGAGGDAGAASNEASIAQAKRWYWQRISAMVLAICVLIHLAVIVHAVRGGLSAEEILGRTRGNWGFAMFYGVFVIACAVHVPVGIANIAEEWFGFEPRNALGLARAFALVLLVMGLRAVVAVVV